MQQIRVGRDQVNAGPGKGAEGLSHLRIEPGQPLFRLQALAIGRIADDDRRPPEFQFRKIGDRNGLEADQRLHPGAQGIVAGDAQGGLAVVASDDLDIGMLVDGGFRLDQQPFPQRGIVLLPAQETEMLAVQSRRDVGGDHRALDDEGTGAGEGIEQAVLAHRLAVPSRGGQQRRGQVFLQRGASMLQAVAAAVQGLPRQVDAEAGAVLVDIQVDTEVGPLLVDDRPATATVAEPVDDGILDLQRRVMAVIDGRTRQGRRHREAVMIAQVFGPVDGQDFLVQRFLAVRLETLDRQVDPVGDARVQAGPVGQFQRTLELDAAIDLLHLVRVRHRRGDVAQLVVQCCLETLRTGDEIAAVGHSSTFSSPP